MWRKGKGSARFFSSSASVRSISPSHASPVTQAQFGDLVGISQPAVSDLLRRRVLADGASADEWLLAYCDHLREVAAGRGGEGSLELASERARLAKEQADKIAMANAITRGELAPARLIEEVIARAGARMGRLLDTIPGLLRRRLPQLTADDVAAVRLLVTKARNVAASMTLEDLDAEDAASEDDTVDIDADPQESAAA